MPAPPIRANAARRTPPPPSADSAPGGAVPKNVLKAAEDGDAEAVERVRECFGRELRAADGHRRRVDGAYGAVHGQPHGEDDVWQGGPRERHLYSKRAVPLDGHALDGAADLPCEQSSSGEAWARQRLLASRMA